MARKTYANVGATKRRYIPQSQPVPGKKMVMNNAGGYVFEADKYTMLERFLILGTDGPTYYTGEKDRTKYNYTNLLNCLKDNYVKTIDMIAAVSDGGRAPSNDPALFALAVAASYGNLYESDDTRSYAMSKIMKVTRTGTHLFHFVDFLNARRSFGRAVRRGLSNWYNYRSIESLGLQLAKYQQRDGWSHKDVIRLAHVNPVNEQVSNALRWSLGKEFDLERAPKMIYCAEMLKHAESVQRVVELIEEYKAPREIVPTEYLNYIDVWIALLPHMGAEALVRNLGTMSKLGVFESQYAETKVATMLTDREYLHRERIHPIKALIGLMQYSSGSGRLGSATWPVSDMVKNSLEETFYLSFANATTTNKKIMCALDVSGSMSWGTCILQIPYFTPAMGAAAMALVLMETEPNVSIVGFATNIVELPLRKGMRLNQAMKITQEYAYGGTDASRAFEYARRTQKDFDAFVCITDNESWAGSIHPFVALDMYRTSVGHPVKLITMSMIANESTIGDTSDPNAVDVVGFDASVPQLISNFMTSDDYSFVQE